MLSNLCGRYLTKPYRFTPQFTFCPYERLHFLVLLFCAIIDLKDSGQGLIHMIIRKCCKEDITLVGAFYDHTVKHLCENINYPKWTYKEYPSENSVRKMTEEGSQFICTDKDEIVGAFVLNDDPQGEYENAAWGRQLTRGQYMVCHTLATKPLLQGKGIGKKLVEFCIDYARKHGYQAIRLDVVPDNFPARRLYERCGFVYVGDVDLERDIEDIPVFSMYELNL